MTCPACSQPFEVVTLTKTHFGHYCDKAGMWLYSNGKVIATAFVQFQQKELTS